MAIKEKIQEKAGTPKIAMKPIKETFISAKINDVFHSLQKLAFWDEETGVYQDPKLVYSEQYQYKGQYMNVPSPRTIEEFEVRIEADKAMIEIMRQTGIDFSRTPKVFGTVDDAVDKIKSGGLSA